MIAIAIVALFLLNLNVGLAAGSASIGDYVWDDQNGDGEQGSEFDMGINDVELELWLDNNGDGRVSDGDMPLGTTTTDSDGRYLFVGLDPGDYIVKVADSNFASGGPLYDYALTTDSDFLSVHLGEGETYNEADFGYEALASPAPTEPTAVSLSSFMASSGLAGSASRGTSFHWPWLMVFVTLAAGGSLWIRRQ